jgi:hypothetical protein
MFDLFNYEVYCFGRPTLIGNLRFHNLRRELLMCRILRNFFKALFGHFFKG